VFATDAAAKDEIGYKGKLEERRGEVNAANAKADDDKRKLRRVLVDGVLGFSSWRGERCRIHFRWVEVDTVRAVRKWAVDGEKTVWAGDDECGIEKAARMLADRREETMVLQVRQRWW